MYSIEIERQPILYPEKYHNYHYAVNQKFSGYIQRGTLVTLTYSSKITGNEINAIKHADESYVDSDPLASILSSVIRPAREFGNLIMEEFIAENVLLGITSSGKAKEVRTILRDTQDALFTGSLYEAISEVRAISKESYDDVFITQKRMLSFINRIETFLNLPLSTTI